MYTKILVAVLVITTLILHGCVVVPANGYGQAAPHITSSNYGRVQPCAPGSVAVGRNPNGSLVCQWQNHNGQQGSGLPNGCVRTVYGMHCSQADGYTLQQPQIPPRTNQQQVQPTCPNGYRLQSVNGQLRCVP
jgi:hypothetical protein